MYKFMLIMSALFQTMISVISNERGEVLVDPPVVEPIVEPVVEPIVEPVVEVAPTKNDLLREISKENGVNLFDIEGIKKFKTFIESQKTDAEKIGEERETFKTEKEAWDVKELGYQSKLEAMRLNIADENLADALKLAGGDPTKLEEVITKYPVFKSKTGIAIGVNNNNGNGAPGDKTEEEKYMAANPKLYGKYLPK